MIKEAIVNGRKYQVDTTPKSSGGYKSLFAKIYAVNESPASGIVANFLRELGKEPVTMTLTIISEQEEAKAVQALGYKFGRSKAWKNLADSHNRKK